MTYPIRGYKDKDGEEIGALTYYEIQELQTPFLYASLLLYNNFKTFGLPHGGGWTQERGTVIEILRILESEANLYDQYEMDKDLKK